MKTSREFKPIRLGGQNLMLDDLQSSGCKEAIWQRKEELPQGQQTFWGIPFDCGEGIRDIDESKRRYLESNRGLLMIDRRVISM